MIRNRTWPVYRSLWADHQIRQISVHFRRGRLLISVGRPKRPKNFLNPVARPPNDIYPFPWMNWEGLVNRFTFSTEVSIPREYFPISLQQGLFGRQMGPGSGEWLLINPILSDHASYLFKKGLCHPSVCSFIINVTLIASCYSDAS